MNDHYGRSIDFYCSLLGMLFSCTQDQLSTSPWLTSKLSVIVFPQFHITANYCERWMCEVLFFFFVLCFTISFFLYTEFNFFQNVLRATETLHPHLRSNSVLHTDKIMFYYTKAPVKYMDCVTLQCIMYFFLNESISRYIMKSNMHICTAVLNHKVLYLISLVHFMLLYISTSLHLRGKYCIFTPSHLSDSFSC